MGRLPSDLTVAELLKSRALGLTLSLCCWGLLTGVAPTGSAASVNARMRAPEDRVATAQPVIERDGDRLSVWVRNTPWAVVLRQLEHRTGIRIQVKGPLAGTLTQEFEGLSLEQGLRQLFHEVNAVFFYAPGRHAGAATGQLTQVWLWPKEAGAAGEGQASRPPATPAAAHQQDEVSASEEESAETNPSDEGAQPEGELAAAEDAPGEHHETVHTLDKQADGEALQQAVFDPDATVQLTAFALFAERDPQGAAALLVRAAQDDQPVIRLQALQLLHHGGLGDEATVLSALGGALGNADMAVKRYAVQALAERGGPEALVSLRYVLRDPDPAVRQMVIEHVIQLIPSDRGLPILQEALTDEDATVRSFAAAWLQQTIADTR
jgi:HEAT repeats